MSNCRRLDVYALSAVLLASTVPGWAAERYQALHEQATTLWNARVQADWATEYRLLAPEETHPATAEQFVAFRKTRGPWHFSSATVGAVAVADNLGWVEITYSARPSAYPQFPARTVQIWDVWQARQDRWYPVPATQRDMLPKLPPQRRPAQEEAVLRQRVEAFWTAREQQDMARLYQLLTPQFQQQVSLEALLQHRDPVTYLSHQVEWAEVDGDQGRVKVLVTYATHQAEQHQQESGQAARPARQRLVLEEWIKADGQWHRRRL